MRALAIIGVVIIHTSTRYAQEGTWEMTAAVYVSTLVRPSIAIFLFLAGYLLHVRHFDGNALSKKAKRVIVPYLLFSFLALAVQYRGGLGGYVSGSPGSFALDLLLGRAWGIYYFVFVILSLYGIAFLALRFSWVTRSLGRVVALLLVINLAHQLWFDDAVVALGCTVEAGVLEYQMRTPLLWAVFFFAGMWVRSSDGATKLLSKRSLVVLAWISVAAAQAAFYFSGVVNTDGYHSGVGTLFSVTTIGLLWRTWPVRAWVQRLSEISYYLFLSHIFLLEALDFWARRSGVELELWWMPVTTVGCVVVPWLLLSLLQRVTGDRTRWLLGA